ncbi:hypothetical protein CDAR_69501 [Caerostris darwini]|uniref:Uncharacterized protein n=1 Tax=Caerostris darwini TaxID=1538125 RepID=A0AAV4U0R2_9ARAC|nr:hypothetical protein CDAR_69501 [Caerostris darwini]
MQIGKPRPLERAKKERNDEKAGKSYRNRRVIVRMPFIHYLLSCDSLRKINFNKGPDSDGERNTGTRKSFDVLNSNVSGGKEIRLPVMQIGKPRPLVRAKKERNDEKAGRVIETVL